MKASMWYSVFKGKCPVCHEGDAFESNEVYNLRKFDKMPERCSHCGHKFEIENGFWYGAMYVSYALTVAISVATFVLTYLIYPEASVWLYISLIVIALIGMAPVTYRASRLVWMNLFTHFDPLKAKKHEQV
jgi:uncharacterized protein (DUF983 family)